MKLHLALPLRMSILFLMTCGAVFAQKPELVVQTGHLKSIVAIAFSVDGKVIASASEDQTIRLWEPGTLRELRILKPYAGDLDASSRNRLIFTPDGQVLIAGDSEGITLWSVSTGAILSQIKKNYRPALSSDGQLLASVEGGYKINLRRVPTGELVRELKVGWEELLNATDLAFTVDGKMLVSPNEKGVRFYDVETGTLAKTISSDARQFHLAFSANGQLLAGATNNSLTIWDLASARELRRMTLPIVVAADTKQTFDNRLYNIAFSSDSRQIAVATLFGMQVWDATTGQQVRSWGDERLTVDRFDTVDFSSDNQALIGGALGGRIHQWDLVSGRELGGSSTLAGNIKHVAFSSDGQRMATEGKTTNIWNLQVGAITQSYKGGYNTLFFTRDNQSLIRGFTGVDRLSLISGQSENLSANGTSGFWQIMDAIAVSPDNELIAGPSEMDLVDKNFDAQHLSKIQLVNVRTNSLVKLLDGHLGVNYLTFSPDSKLLASAGLDNNIKLWDVATGKTLRIFSGHKNPVTSLAFNPKGDLLASSGIDSFIKIWNVNTAAAVQTLSIPRPSDSVVFSPDGHIVAAGVWDGTVRLWDAASGADLATLNGHTDKVRSVVFTPDGRLLASVGDDDTVRLWRVADRQLLATIIVTGTKDWLVVTPDGLFDGTPAAWSQIQWRFSEKLFDVAPVEWFFSDLYYPGLLADIVADKRPQAKQDIGQKDRRQPVVKLSVSGLPSSDQKVSNRNVKVRVEISDALAGTQDVRLFRNGSMVKAWRGDVLHGMSTALLETTVSIVAGENRLSAYAFNHDNIKSQDSQLVLTGADSLKRKGATYILAVGVNEYANTQYNLRYAVADAQDFAAEVKHQQEVLGQYARVEVISLFDKEATKANILKSLTELATKTQPEDAIIIYFSGHGTAHGNRFYLVPHDLGYDGPRTELDRASLQNILAHSVSDEELEKAVEVIDASQLLLVIDACNSGQALEAEEKRRGPMNSKGLAQLAYEKGMYILTAAQSYQAAMEASKLGHGYLTYALVEEGLKTPVADIEPKDKQVLLREWLDYATNRVPQMQQEKIDEGKRELVEEAVAFTNGEEKVIPSKRSVQRPRVFYRREAEAQPLVVMRP